MAHMLAIKFYTSNMVDCQLPERERSFWLSETWLGLHIILQSSGSTAPKHISRIPWWATGQEQGWKGIFPPQGKLYFCHILQAVSQGFPILHTLSLSKPHILGLEFQSSPSPELGFSCCPAGSMLLSPVQGVKARANCKHKPNPFPAPTAFNLLLIALTLNLQMLRVEKKELGVFFVCFTCISHSQCPHVCCT